MKVVSPFRPFPIDNPAHEKLGPYDWIGALRMCAASVARSCACPHYTLTDVDTDLPVAAHRYATRERRLMLWILEVSVCYLKSADFDDDTVFIGADVLALRDLQFGFVADLGVVVRTHEKFADAYPILNSAQWWRLDARDRLVAFYEEALRLASALHETVIQWGADTAPLCTLLWPVVAGPSERSGLSVMGWGEDATICGLMSADVWRLENRQHTILPAAPLLDFRYKRKLYMRAWYERTFGAVPS